VRTAWTDEELEHYRAAFDEPRKLKGPLAYYRTAFRNALLRRGAGLGGPIQAPTLVLWGMRDRFLAPGFADPERLRPHTTNVEVVKIEEAGHYVQNEAPERVNAELLRWLEATTAEDAPEEPAAEHRREDEPDH
jgi:pimeloyl-ACP methyl ester carboxylesterase